MSDLYDSTEHDKILIEGDGGGLDEVEEIIEEDVRPAYDARRRLEDLLDEKRLKDELEDFWDEK